MDFDVYRVDQKQNQPWSGRYKSSPRLRFAWEMMGDRLCPGVDWKGFRGMGNILRHGYHRIDDKIVWDTVKDELPPVKTAVLRALNAPPASPESPNLG
jgi:hypothetical protein